jgi:hypothetical protein
MKTKTILVMGLVVVIGVAVASVVVARREAAQQAASQAVKAKSDQARNQARPAVTTAVEPAAPEQLPSEPTGLPPPVKAGGQSNVKTQAVTAATQPYLDPRLHDPAVREQLGRLALSFVGDDPGADEVWIQVINDPKLPANARQNLIEDLNEDGLSDPRNPTVDDLPLILSRLQLIEELAPDALDEVNAAAFQEAYKDLVNMAVRLIR